MSYHASLSAPPKDGVTHLRVACSPRGPPLRLAPGPGGWATGPCAATVAFSADNYSQPVPISVWYPDDLRRRALREDTILWHTLPGAGVGVTLAATARDNDHPGIRTQVRALPLPP